jgi:hypothetical protein
MTTLSITGLERMMKKLRKMPVEMAKATEKIVKMEAVGVCVAMGKVSGPGRLWSLAENDLVKYKTRVENQIRAVFPSSQNPRYVGVLIKRKNPKYYYAYLRAMEQKKPHQARRYLAASGIKVDQLNRADHKARRTDKGGGVPESVFPVSVVNAAAVRVYVRERTGNVGMVKAAWYQAAQGLVKRVRGSIHDKHGPRTSYQHFPSSVRKVAGKYPGLGYASVKGSGFKTTVYVASRVRHAREATDEHGKNELLSVTKEGIATAIYYTIKSMNKKLFG